jgi:hypothetical protein
MIVVEVVQIGIAVEGVSVSWHRIVAGRRLVTRKGRTERAEGKSKTTWNAVP